MKTSERKGKWTHMRSQIVIEGRERMQHIMERLRTVMRLAVGEDAWDNHNRDGKGIRIEMT